MKKIWRIFLIATVLLSGLHGKDTSWGETQTKLSILPKQIIVTQGATFTLRVDVSNITNLIVGEIYILFDPQILRVIDANPSTLKIEIQQGPFLTGTIYKNEVDNTIGRIDYTAVATPFVSVLT